MHPVAVSEVAVGLDGSKPLSVGLSGPPGLCGAADAASTAPYVATPSGDPRCQPPEAASLPMEPDEVAGSGVGPVPGAGHLVAGSEELPEPTSSPALRLPAHWVVASLPPETVLRSPACTTGLFFFPRVSRTLLSRRWGGDDEALLPLTAALLIRMY
jgi:hypothetical protein